MQRAICSNCGNEKKEPQLICKACGHDPTASEEEMVKAVYLSLGRFENESDQQSYKSQLQSYSAHIKSGQSIEYEPNEIQRLTHQKHLVESVSTTDVWLYLAKFFFPAIIFIASLFILGYLVSLFNQ